MFQATVDICLNTSCLAWQYYLHTRQQLFEHALPGSTISTHANSCLNTSCLAWQYYLHTCQQLFEHILPCLAVLSSHMPTVVWTHLALPGSTLFTHANSCLNTSCLAWQYSLHTCQQLFEHILPCLAVLSSHMPTVVWTHLALPGSTLFTHANSCLNTSCLAWQYSLHTCQQLFEHILPCLAVLSPHMPTVVWTHLALPGSTLFTHANSCLNTFCLAWQYSLHTCQQLFEHILPCLAVLSSHMPTVVWTHLALPGSTLFTHANSCLNTSCLAWQYSLHTCQQLFEHILPCLAVLSSHMPTVVWTHFALSGNTTSTHADLLTALQSFVPWLQPCSLLFLGYSLSAFCSLVTAFQPFVPWLQPCSLLFLDYSLAYLCWLLFWITDLLFRKCETEHGRGPHQYDRLIWMLTEHIATTSCSESDTVSSE